LYKYDYLGLAFWVITGCDENGAPEHAGTSSYAGVEKAAVGQTGLIELNRTSIGQP